MRSAAIHRMLAGALPRHGAPRASLLALCSESAPSHLYCTRCSNPLGGDWDVGAAVAGLLGFSCLWEHVIQRVQSLGLQFSSVQLLSGVLLFATPWTAAHQASLSITNFRSLLKLMSIESVMPSNHLILCHPLLLLPSIFPSIRVVSNESVLRIRWPKYWSFSFGISPSNVYSGLIFFRMDLFDILAVQGALKSLLQQHSSKASISQHSACMT